MPSAAKTTTPGSTPSAPAGAEFHPQSGRAAALQGIDVPVHVLQSGHDGHLSIVVKRFDECARSILQAA